MALCGGLMIGVESSDPKVPPLVIVKTPPSRSARAILPSRARAAASRRIASAHDDDLALPAEERAEMIARGQRAVLYAPILAGDQVVGFLCAIERRHSRRFTKADEAFAAQLAGDAGVAVESARVIDRLDSQNREQRLMLETGAAIASSVDLRTTLSTIAERLRRTLTRMGTITSRRQDGCSLDTTSRRSRARAR